MSENTKASKAGSHREDPLTLSLSPRGEGTPELPPALPQPSPSPLGERAGVRGSSAAQISPGLAHRLRERTAGLHRQARLTGFMRDILRRKATLGGYALLLRNLWPVYSGLEAALERRRALPGAGRFARPILYRASAIARDLAVISGPDWAEQVPLLEAGQAYAARVAAAATWDGEGLIAHAYTRYLGDLNGGQVVRDVLCKTIGLGAGKNAFYTFEGSVPLEELRAEFRHDLDRAGSEIASPSAVIEEAARAFECNIALSRAVHDAWRAMMPAT
jgi:heme oxygenase (biliverdin-producing, ferredoxin)